MLRLESRHPAVTFGKSPYWFVRRPSWSLRILLLTTSVHYLLVLISLSHNLFSRLRWHRLDKDSDDEINAERCQSSIMQSKRVRRLECSKIQSCESVAYEVRYVAYVFVASVLFRRCKVNTMEFPDVSDTWRAFGSQQSLLRLRQADHAALHDADAATTAGAIASSAGAASSAAESSQAKATSASTAVLPQNQYGFQQRSRIHIVVEDPSQLHSLVRQMNK